MKKLLLIAAAAVFAFGTAAAQKQTKAEKEAAKMQQEIATSAYVKKIVDARNFQYMPVEYTRGNSLKQNALEEDQLIVRPDNILVSLGATSFVRTNEYEVVSDEMVKNNREVKIKATADDNSQVILTFIIDPKTAKTKLKINSSKAGYVVYEGTIQEAPRER